MPRARREFIATNVSTFVKLFEPNRSLSSSSPQWYRGDTAFRKRRALLPSIARPRAHVRPEWEIYQRFRQDAAAFLPHARLSEWDWMLYMRHYGLLTRLLDWSESALVALYFAVLGKRHSGRDGVVWCLDPLRLNELAGFERRIHCAGIDTELDVYTSESLKTATMDSAFRPVALIAPRSFPRLIAQQGVFTVTHRQQLSLEEIADPDLLATIRIPAMAKPQIRVSLRSLGMSQLSLFPELQSLADQD
jgi:hypothetical protein